MKRWLALLFASAALLAAPIHAQTEGEGSGEAAISATSLQVGLALAGIRYALPPQPAAPVWQPAQYGPFRVVAPDRVEMAGATDSGTPEQFAAMLRDHPGVRRITMLRCPGTYDDIANLKLGRMIRAAGLATHVPASGSVRSGAVDLFLAGRERVIEEGAEFAVHSWQDRFGREADSFAADEGPNRAYLNYYREIGMDPASAQDFYAFTNSVPHREALWLEAGEMRGWLARLEEGKRASKRPELASAKAAELMAMPGIARLELSGLALLDLALLYRTGLSPRHPVSSMLDSHRRL